MSDRITTFKLDWYDCGLCCIEDVVHERLTISRNKNALEFVRFNGRGDPLSSETIGIQQASVDSLFSLLEHLDTHWGTDYRVDVCDGSSWEITVRYSTNKTKHIHGTVEYPPYGPEVENQIRQILRQYQTFLEPIIFGCGEH